MDFLDEVMPAPVDPEAAPGGAADTHNADGASDGDDEPAFLDPTVSSPGMPEFRRTHGEVGEMLVVVASETRELQELYAQAVQTTSAERRDFNDRTRALEQSILSTLGRGSEGIKELRRLATEAHEVAPQDVDTRVRLNMADQIFERYQRTVAQYNQVHIAGRQRVQDQIRREFRQHQLELSPEEIERLVASGTAQDYLAQHIGSASRQQASHMLHIALEQREALEEIAQQVAELKFLLSEMLTLAQLQGEQLDQIEANISQTHNYVARGNQNLTKTIQQQKKYRRKILLLMAIIIVVIVVLVPLGIFLGLR